MLKKFLTKKSSKSGSKWKRKEVALFLEQMSLYISSGLSIDKSLFVIAEGNVRRSADCIEMKRLVERGASFSKTFAIKIPHLSAVSAIIEQGESSGKLSDSLSMAQELLERSDELRKKCLSALTYPLVIGIFSVLLTLGLVRGVMPQIIPLLLSLRVELPILTRAVIFLSKLITSHGVLILGSVIAGYFSLLYTYRNFLKFKYTVHRCLGMLPLLGPLVRLYWTSHFLRMYGSLLSSGISSPRSYAGAVSTVTYLPLSRYLSERSIAVFDGAQLRSIFIQKKFPFPSYVSALVTAGESSGQMAESLLRAAELIDKELSHTLKKLTSLMEPLMMAAMGIVVGAIALSIMLPIYDISKVLQR